MPPMPSTSWWSLINAHLIAQLVFKLNPTSSSFHGLHTLLTMYKSQMWHIFWSLHSLDSVQCMTTRLPHYLQNHSWPTSVFTSNKSCLSHPNLFRHFCHILVVRQRTPSLGRKFQHGCLICFDDERPSCFSCLIILGCNFQNCWATAQNSWSGNNRKCWILPYFPTLLGLNLRREAFYCSSH